MNALVRPHSSNFTVNSVLERCGRAVALCFVDDPAKQLPMKSELLSHNEKCLVARISMQGRSLILKAFDPDNPDTVWNMRRETQVARKLGETGLAAKVVGVNETNRFIVLKYLEGASLAESLVASNLGEVSEMLGQWFAQFNDAMPSQSIQSDWLNYLKRYKEPALQDLVQRCSALLKGLPLTEVRIAKNDSFLHNFILSSDDKISGVDFEKSAIKPVGWDLLLTTRILAKEFPEHVEVIASNLLKGWGGHVAGIPASNFAELCVVFAEGTASRTVGEHVFTLDKVKIDYEQARLENPSLPQADRVVKVPYMHKAMTEVTQDEREVFSKWLLKEAERALKPERDLDAAVGISEGSNEPGTLMAQACALCSGGCCQPGKLSNAFLKAEELRRHVERDPETTAADILDRYLKYMPNRHVRGSCLFHGEAGCTISRKDRSKVCNEYLCESAKVIAELPNTAQEIKERTLIVSVDGGKVLRSKITIP